MKTSNYITISFFVFLFGGIFVLFLDAKIDPRGSLHPEFVNEEKPLDNFSVVVAKAGANICVKSGDSTKVGLHYLKGDTCTLPSHIVRNDTLFVDANPKKNKHWSTNIFCKQINSIEGKENSQIRMERFQCDSLLVKLNKAEFRYYSEKNPVGFSLRLIAADSYVNINGATISNLNLNLNHTKMDAWGNRITNLSGELKENSRLSLDRIQKTNMEADSTSTYRLEK